MIVDGAALLAQLLARPGAPIVLSYDQALAIARALATAQAMADGQRRLGVAMLGIGGERP